MDIVNEGRGYECFLVHDASSICLSQHWMQMMEKYLAKQTEMYGTFLETPIIFLKQGGQELGSMFRVYIMVTSLPPDHTADPLVISL